MTNGGNETITDVADGGGRRASRWRVGAWATAALAVLAPWVAMQFTDEVSWSGADFAFVGALLLGVGTVLDLAMRASADPAYRGAVGLALGTAVLLVLVNGAVGIVGSEDDGVNLLFGGVIVVGAVGALIARFRPAGMARAMAATALAQASVAVGALVAGLASVESGAFEVVALWLFVALWAASAALFRRAARRRPPVGA